MIKAVKQNMMPSVLSVAVWVALGQAHAIPAANTLPSGENVVIGSASFNRNIANRLIVNQDSDRLLTNWNSFDVGSDARVSFKQPSSSSIALNRVTTASPTEIFGAINANGQIFIVNPNGILFGAASQVRASSIVASTLGVINDTEFRDKPNVALHSTNVNGAIENQGTLITSNGPIALLANTVKNNGRIQAKGGNAVLANAVNMELYTSKDIFLVGPSSFGIIKNSGLVQAIKLENKGGKVVLEGGTWLGANSLELGGRILSTDGLEVTASSINVADFLSDNNTSFNTRKISFNGVFRLEGENSRLSMENSLDYPFQDTKYDFGNTGKINFKGSNSSFMVNGDDFELIRSVPELYDFSQRNSFSWQYALATDLDMNSYIPSPGMPKFKPIGSSERPFNGTFDGLGHSIRNLRIEQPRGYASFFGYTRKSTISNLNLINVNMSGFAAAGLVYSNQGDLFNNKVTGNITASISDYSYSYFYPDYFDPYYFYNNNISLVAGLVGINEHGRILNNQVNIKVSSKGHTDRNWIIPNGALGQAGLAGGLIAFDSGMQTIGNTVAGAVSGQYKVGGLIGENHASVYGNTSSANVILTKPLNSTNPYGLVGALIGKDTSGASSNVSTGTVTIK